MKIVKTFCVLAMLHIVAGTVTAGNNDKLQNLDALPKSAIADLRTFEDAVYYNVRILEVAQEKVIFEQNGEIKELRRATVFRVIADGTVFTDTSISAEQNAKLESALDYKAAFWDYVLRADYMRFSGTIISADDRQISITQDNAIHSVLLSDIIVYRRGGVEKRLQDREIPPHWLRRLAVPDENRWHLTEGILGISSPLNIFPQVTLGLQTNSSWPVYAGVRVGASGNLVTAGWYYAQAQFYLGINLMRIDYWHVALVTGYLYRNHFMNTPISCNCEPSSAGYFSDFTTVVFSQKNYYIAAAMKFRSIYVEIGVEIPDYFSAAVDRPNTHGAAISAENQARIESSVDAANSFATGVANYSRLYFSAGFAFGLL